MRKILWLAVSGLMALSLVIAACGPGANTTALTAPTTPTTHTTPAKPVEEPTQKETIKPTGEVPKYGGTLNIVGGDRTNFDPTLATGQTSGVGQDIVIDPLWEGDWARGPAGGYGTNELDFATDYDIWDIKTGVIAESTKWTYSFEKNEATIVYQIRQGIHWGLNPASEAARL